MTKGKNTMKEKILVWNINLATNRNIEIPYFVGEEIKRQNSDFIILTEFCKTKNYEGFCHKYLKDNGYIYTISNNSDKHNDVLIAWKQEKFQLIEIKNEFQTTETTPNFTYVLLKNKHGLEFVLAGIRITIENYENRKKQFEFALNELRNYSYVIIGGDFNCLRRGTLLHSKWSLYVLSETSKEAGFALITPKGQSIYTEKAISEDYEFAEDNFIVKGMTIENELYDRDFALKYSNVYLYEKNFSVYDSYLKRNKWSITIGSGIPDHAILNGYVCFDDNIYMKHQEDYLEDEKYPVDKNLYPDSYVCPRCGRIIKNTGKFSSPDICDECYRKEE